MPLTDSKAIINSAGKFYLQPSISVIIVQTAAELKIQHIYALNASDDLSSGHIPLVADHKINYKYPKSLITPILNTTYYRVYIPRATLFGTLNSIDTDNTKFSNILWTKTENSQDDIRNNPTELLATPKNQASNWSTVI